MANVLLLKLEISLIELSEGSAFPVFLEGGKAAIHRGRVTLCRCSRC